MLEKQEPVTTWIIDDTGFPKQGKHSVGVQRQYSGTLGKVGNCQVGVSLTIATKHEHVPIDFALYMPQSWIDDGVRRDKARVPEDLVLKTKPDLALDLVTAPSRTRSPGTSCSSMPRTVGRATSGTPCGCSAWTSASRFRQP